MSFRNNGHKRDPKKIFSAAFLIIVGILCLIVGPTSHFSNTMSIAVGVAMLFLGIIMFKNSNEM